VYVVATVFVDVVAGMTMKHPEFDPPSINVPVGAPEMVHRTVPSDENGVAV
jgi:hypothetical protein